MGPRQAMGCSASIMNPMDMTSTPCAVSGIMCLPSAAISGFWPAKPIIKGWLGP
jgi:hypothetical protein